MENFSNIKDIIVLREINLDAKKIYNLTIAGACFTNGDTELKILFRLKDMETGDVFYILESLKVGTQEYLEMLCRIYFDDTQVLCVNTSDFRDFSAECKVTSSFPHMIDWNTVSVWSKPISWLDTTNNDHCDKEDN